MRISTLSGLAMFLSFFVVFFFAARFVIFSSRHFDKSHPEYERLTMGNPLNAVFFSRLLTNAGNRQRAMIGTVLGAIWGLFVPAALIASGLGAR